MSFEITNKVALISGGASGIGLKYAKELLRNGLRGVTLADINAEYGKQALQEIQNEFGPNKAIFIPTDVTNKSSYEAAFEKTIQTYKNLDILINNAGILDDSKWEKEIDINIKGVFYGTILGLETYIPKYRSGDEGVIVNISSIAGVQAFGVIPVYTATKFAVLGMSKAFATHYNTTKVKVLIMCPGVTDTPLLYTMEKKTLGERYSKKIEEEVVILPLQKPDCVARGMIKIIKNGKPGTAWVVEHGKEAYEFPLTPRENFASK